MNVLVTGGTGFVGRAVVHALREREHRVRILTRHPPRHGNEAAGSRVEYVAGDVLAAESLTAACLGVDAVVHLVGIISECGGQTFEAVHARGTGNIVDAAQRAGVRRFVHMSALGTRPNAVARYHQSKWQAEETVRHSGLDWTIFRPSIIYGPGDGFVNLFARMSRWSPVMPLIGGGKMRFAPVPVESVASAFGKSVSDPQTAGETYDLCGPEILTLEQIIDAILRVTGRRRVKLRIPFAVARAQAACAELLYGLARKPPPLNRDQLLMLREDNAGNCAPARAQFGLDFPPFESRIAQYLRP